MTQPGTAAADTRPPQERVAARFMERKGYRGSRAYLVDKVDEAWCWYFRFKVEGGVVELEVTWDPKTRRWSYLGTNFLVE